MHWGASLRLRTGVWLWRHGWGVLLLAGAVVIAPAAHLVRLQVEAQSQQAHVRIGKLRSSLAAAARQPAAPKTPASPDQQTLSALHRIVYSQGDVNRIVRQLYALGTQHQLDLQQADFRQDTQGFGGLVQQQVTLPVQARYPQLKAFMLQALQQFPGLSIDQIVIQRESVAQDRPEVTLKLSIWVSPGTTAPTIKTTQPGRGS
ncbi:MAG: hypothetical protein A2W72_24225 [Burkholderiales bacterium RIFCSPLOWO2_12_67_14]|nr:MAG: hypothetical protein A3I64_06985 [Burkholderiales bacterium RIFCSPLOWO2_02_FULL_67_64]OGB39983.1 MAG: hypothetical protein A3E51_05270 [Burkholderiales bacterium RIFCSPHIGHO2_12_FULL_67_38]OGB43963.1 MAG: hypothetical protein A2W72_24225 [Burkholderiales bacterium RIFCSPLOWO2_12_67_14]OGB88751.1 MAG: hypothetical protein A3G82_13720 [Burkholderiales bacterium RIFCSPLOWO2_12_FULL_67_210]